jgi:hypothetical protein
MPLALRQEIVPLVAHFTHFFVLYQKGFSNNDNLAYFGNPVNTDTFRATIESWQGDLQRSLVTWADGRVQTGIHYTSGCRYGQQLGRLPLTTCTYITDTTCYMTRLLLQVACRSEA